MYKHIYCKGKSVEELESISGIFIEKRFDNLIEFQFPSLQCLQNSLTISDAMPNAFECEQEE